MTLEPKGTNPDGGERVVMNIPLPQHVVDWLTAHSANDDEAKEMASSMITMVVDDDMAAHETMH